MRIKILSLYGIILFFVFFLSIFDVRCKNPEDFKPTEDSLIEPPEPPELISPPADTIYVWTPGIGDIYNLDFEWTFVNGAERYELEVSTDATFQNSEIHATGVNSITIGFHNCNKYFWHVRAISKAWTWYTEWSVLRSFRIIPPIH